MHDALSLRKKILRHARSCERSVIRSANIKPQQIVDTIFFPAFHHSPIVRVNGVNLTFRRAQEIEKKSFFALVRLPQFAGSPTKKTFTKFRSLKSVTISSPDDGHPQWIKPLLSFIKQVSPSAQECAIWEVEVENKQIIVRLFSHHTTKPIQRDGFIIEKINVHRTDAQLLLTIFDLAKYLSIPFLAFLNRHPPTKRAASYKRRGS